MSLLKRRRGEIHVVRSFFSGRLLLLCVLSDGGKVFFSVPTQGRNFSLFFPHSRGVSGGGVSKRSVTFPLIRLQKLSLNLFVLAADCDAWRGSWRNGAKYHRPAECHGCRRRSARPQLAPARVEDVCCSRRLKKKKKKIPRNPTTYSRRLCFLIFVGKTCFFLFLSLIKAASAASDWSLVLLASLPNSNRNCNRWSNQEQAGVRFFTESCY